MKMNKNKWINKISNKFNLPLNAKLTFFQNPSLFSNFKIEKINPTHKLLIYGKIPKRNKNTNQIYIKIGKIYVPSICLITCYLSFLNIYLAYIISNILLGFSLSLFIYGLPIFKGEIKTWINHLIHLRFYHALSLS